MVIIGMYNICRMNGRTISQYNASAKVLCREKNAERSENEELQELESQYSEPVTERACIRMDRVWDHLLIKKTYASYMLIL